MGASRLDKYYGRYDITAEEVEEVLKAHHGKSTFSRSSGQSITFGWTSLGRHIAVVYEHVSDDPLTFYPITAYEAPAPQE